MPHFTVNSATFNGIICGITNLSVGREDQNLLWNWEMQKDLLQKAYCFSSMAYCLFGKAKITSQPLIVYVFLCVQIISIYF